MFKVGQKVKVASIEETDYDDGYYKFAGQIITIMAVHPGGWYTVDRRYDDGKLEFPFNDCKHWKIREKHLKPLKEQLEFAFMEKK
jgi:hypothetical protein